MEIKELMNEKLKEYNAYAPAIFSTSLGPKAKEIIKLNANEMQMGPSKKAMEAAIAELPNCHLYPQPVIKKLKERIAEYAGKPADNVEVYSGAGGAIQVIGEVFLNPEDEVLICSPTYMAYYNLPLRFGATLKEVKADDGVSTCLTKLKEGITEKTKLIFICNPNNPTGTLLDNDKLDEFVSELPENVICVIDEAYYDWISVPDYKSAFRFVDDNHKVIVLRTFSKLYGMAGFRVGYSVANKEITKCLKSISNYYNTNRVGAAAALAAMDDTEFNEAAFKNNTEQREYLMKELEALGMKVVPSQTSFIYFTPDCDAKTIVDKLQEYGVYIRPFGEHLRVSVGVPHQCKIFIDALTEVLNELRAK